MVDLLAAQPEEGSSRKRYSGLDGAPEHRTSLADSRPH